MWQLSFFIVRQPDQFRRKHPYDRVIAYLVMISTRVIAYLVNDLL